MIRSFSSHPVLGARLETNGVHFGAYVTAAESCAVRIYGENGRILSVHPMARRPGDAHFEAFVPDLKAGARYRFVVGERELPDPWARYLPFGVHGPAMVMDSTFAWQHGPGVSRPLEEQVIYELHIGTFTPEGTFDAARARLSDLVQLGVTTLELMPVAAFAGSRGWGYDGVALYAPFAGYGTPHDLRRFVDQAHGLGLGVMLDVVYNHFGPSGNYLGAYSDVFFAPDVQSGWGEGPNFAHPAMRRYVLDNAQYWLDEFRFDGLRLDAVPAIHDPSPTSIVQEIAAMAAGLTPGKVIIAEDDRNEPGLVSKWGLNAIWADDFHHQVHATLTGERDGYYVAYQPGIAGVARVLTRGWLYEGAVSAFTGRPRGKEANALPASAFVYCLQNHDQIGNRALGERLCAGDSGISGISLDAYCAVSALLLLVPMTPLLFMGQEWAATSPFLYFTDHDEELGLLVSAGRREEFKSFSLFSDPAARERIPDPQARETFERSRLRWEERDKEPHQRVFRLVRELLDMRKNDPVFRNGSRERMRAEAQGGWLIVERWNDGDARVVLLNLSREHLPWPDAVRGLTRGWSSAARGSNAETATVWANVRAAEPEK